MFTSRQSRDILMQMNIKNVDKISRNIKNATIKKEYQKISDTSADNIFYKYNTNKDGLTNEEAKLRLKKEGKHIVGKTPNKWYNSLILALLDPLFLIIIGIATINMFLGTFFASGMTYLFAVVLISIRFFCLLYNSQTQKILLQKSLISVTVLREGVKSQIDKVYLVTGDIVVLTKNCVAPADMYLFDKKSVELDKELYEDEFPQNIALMGQEVKDGECYGIVIKKSKQTYLSKLLSANKPASTPFAKSISRLTQLFMAFGFTVILAIFLIGGIKKLDSWLNILLFVCALAFGISHDMFSFFVKFCSARSIRQNYKKQVFIKNSSALQNISQIEVIFCDLADIDLDQKENTKGTKFFITSNMLSDFDKNTKKITAAELAKLDAKEAKKVISNTTLFVDFTSAQKQEVLRLGKNQNQTLCYFGTDATLLRLADVGITTTDATDMCKISADIIVQNKSMTQIDELLISGHKARINTKRMLSSIASTNTLTLLPFLVATIVLPFTPLTAAIILFTKIVSTITCLTITSDNIDKNFKHEVTKWTTKSLLQKTVFTAVFSLVFYSVIVVLLTYALGYKTVADANNFQTGFFVFSIVFSTLIIFSARHKTFLSRTDLPSLFFTLACVIALVAAIALPFVFKLTKYSFFAMPNALFFAYLTGIIALAFIVLLSTKYYMLKKKKQ